MFGDLDLDWPLNASRGFVGGISWVSCSYSRRGGTICTKDQATRSLDWTSKRTAHLPAILLTFQILNRSWNTDLRPRRCVVICRPRLKQIWNVFWHRSCTWQQKPVQLVTDTDSVLFKIKFWMKKALGGDANIARWQ